MNLVFNPTGTQVRKGCLQIRMDWIPSELDAAYKVHYVYVPVIGDKVYTGKVDEMGSPIDSDDYQKWLDSLPHIWRVNPCLGEIITVPETVCKEDIDAWAELKLDRDTPATLNKMWDDYRLGLLTKPISHSISPYFRDRGKYTTEKVLTKDYVDLVASVNQRLCPGLVPITKALTSDGIARTVEPESIDVGYSPTNESLYVSGGSSTQIGTNNPANDTGTLDTYEYWAFYAHPTNHGYFGTAYSTGGTDWKTRDSEDVGVLTSGSKQTITGLSISVVTGDNLLQYGGVDLEASYAASGDVYQVSGDYSAANAETTYTQLARFKWGLYATGTEAGGDVGGSPIPVLLHLGRMARY